MILNCRFCFLATHESQPVRNALEAGAGIELMVGSNTDEHRLFLVPAYDDGGSAIEHISNEALAATAAA